MFGKVLEEGLEDTQVLIRRLYGTKAGAICVVLAYLRWETITRRPSRPSETAATEI
jgi:hypothetical protein